MLRSLPLFLGGAALLVLIEVVFFSLLAPYCAPPPTLSEAPSDTQASPDRPGADPPVDASR